MINATLPRSLPPCVCASVKIQDSENSTNERESKQHQNGAALPFQEGRLLDLVFKSRKQLQTGDLMRVAYEIILEWPRGEENKLFPPGEAIGIICPNVDAEVEKTLRLIGRTGTEWLEVSSAMGEVASRRFERQFQYVPRRCSVRYLLTHVVDLRTVLKKVFLKLLGDCCPEDSEDREKLYEMSSNADSYAKNILENRMMIFDILETFPLCSPSLSLLIENLSRLGPRFYSVANYDPERVRIIYRPMTFDSNGKTLMGQCSTYFEKLDNIDTAMENLSIEGAAHRGLTYATQASNLLCYLRKNVRSFAFPCDNRTPFIFICHGTGVAPLEAYLDWLEQSDLKTTQCERWIFYGCRDMRRDDLFNIEKAEKLGFRIVLRQSRVGPKQAYIQSAIPDHSEDIVRVIKDSGGQILICGDYKTMAAETLTALKGVLNTGNAPEFVSELLTQNRIKLDVWT